jgi:Family of unknown function (DUF5681)
MRFQPGQSGNPAGRPPGALNKKTLATEAMLAQRAEASVAKIIDRADNGEPAAMRLCMERMAPSAGSRPLPFELPPVETPEDVAAAARAVMKAMAEGEIAPRETVNLLAVVAAAARIADRVQSMKERHKVWWGGGLHDTARAALGAVLREHGFDDAFLYSPVNSDAADGEPEHPPIEAAKSAPEAKASDKAAAAPTAARKEQDGLYFPVNSNASAAKAAPRSATRTGMATPEMPAAPALAAAIREHVDALRAHAPGSTASRRRRALMESVSPAALRLGALPVDSRSYVTDQTWLALMLETGPHGAIKRKAA